ncbi:unnamed protein product [Ectocarpus sp. 6 AP-2014]
MASRGSGSSTRRAIPDATEAGWIARTGGGVTRFSRSKSKGKGKKHASPPPQAQAEEPNVDDDVEADLSSVRNVSAGSDPSARASKSVVSGGGAGRQSTGAAPQGSSSQPVPAPSTRRQSAPPLPVLAGERLRQQQCRARSILRRNIFAEHLTQDFWYVWRDHTLAPCCCLRLRFWCCPRRCRCCLRLRFFCS